MVKVIAGIIEREGRILIAQKATEGPFKDKWEFPGGKIKDNETPEECLKRELFEELGIETEVGEFVCSSRYEYSHMSIELCAYKVTCSSGEITLNDHKAAKWVLPSELDRYDFPEADLPIIKKLQRKGFHSP